MPTQCRLINSDEFNDEFNSIHTQPGDIWYAPWLIDDTENWMYSGLSPEYIRDWKGKRLPIYIKLPNGHIFCPDIKFGGGSNDGYKENGWTVTGELPNITISPSINSLAGNPKGYHGWLQNGILSDDLEGRIYNKI